MARHPVRLTPSQDAVAILVGNGFAVELVASAGVKLKIARQSPGIGHGLLRWLAAVALLELHQLVGMFSHFA